ncbi:hypothetical protein GZ77_18150 [Endozoicomonas montiporae]|uniref:Uncharacterized protein n=2 Tax=Endozoicomonas montiporae TaxID=1027273 RepID=A0A081N1X6_9GAMM|nr:hypothetical protein [Endozoicomonas montiporae]AMO58601.1 hypothetical protein EZMO1_4698 [Endozoicomonas montiporae CL-33]KEQ12449.1 hypothetical protein GZ77_18150 [Endozoicomonas montiporae]
MNRKQALEIALVALNTQQVEANHYARGQYTSEKTRQYWQQQHDEAKAAYRVLIELLKETNNKLGEARA